MKIGPLVSPLVLAVGPRHNLRDVARRMTERKIGCAVVLCDDGHPGIITERDVLGAIAAGVDPEASTVEEYMTANAITASPSWEVREAATRMMQGGFRHLIVVDENGNVTGVLSIRDLVKPLFDMLGP